ncbi:MAG TPA: hypothetical protein VIF43_03100 [Patescibacteria group bacterium]|jgi:hypothetical protein
MARRFSSGIKYERRPLLRGWAAVTLPGTEEVKLTVRQSLKLRSAVAIGRRVRRRRDKITELESQNSEDRGLVEKILKPFRQKGISGVVSHRGKRPFRTMLVERTGFEVGDNRELCSWLLEGGDGAKKVLKGCVIKPTGTDDPLEMLRFLALVAKHFPDQFNDLFELQIDLKELNKVIEQRDEEPPEGTVIEKDPTDFLLAEFKA